MTSRTYRRYSPVGSMQLSEAVPATLRNVTPQVERLWWAGDRSLLSRGLRVGIIGSRTPRADSVQHAQRIAADAARMGCTIVSGLARGIDGVAHDAALTWGAPTIAVLGSGLGYIHPKRHREMAQRIAGSVTRLGVQYGAGEHAAGLVLSEYGTGDQPPLPHHFAERNRIIAGICDYLVVIQAGVKSGSMITANCALELGVPIGIVPSGPGESCHEGCIGLLRDGADAVVDGVSLAQRLAAHGLVDRAFAAALRAGQQVRLDPADPGRFSDAVGEQLALPDHPLSSILHIPRTVDDIARLTDLARTDVLRLLADLDGDGLVTACPDGTWVSAASPVV